MSERSIPTRKAGAADIDAIVSLVNRAYEVESFFVKGDRVTNASVAADLTQGAILLAEDANGRIEACVFVSVTDARGYFGMLAVEPQSQGRGLGHAMIAEAENHARRHGATVMTISVVNLRTDLLGFYVRLGYRATGDAPYVHRPVIQPVHFISMEKPL